MGEIADAMERARQRKDAAGLPTALDIEPGAQTEDDAEALGRRLFSGLDLDIDEVLVVAERVRKLGQATAIMSGLGPGMLASGFWMDGLLVGLLLAEARDRESSGGGGQ